MRVTLLSWVPADCGAGSGSAESRSCRGSDGRREAPGRAGLRESAQAMATARRRTRSTGLLPEVSDAELSAAAALSLQSSPCFLRVEVYWERAGGADRAGCVTPGKEARAPFSAASQQPLISVIALHVLNTTNVLGLTEILFVAGLLEFFTWFKENTCLFQQQLYSLPYVLRKAGKCCLQ